MREAVFLALEDGYDTDIRSRETIQPVRPPSDQASD